MATVHPQITDGRLVEPLMYPHRYDRFHLLRLLVRHAREHYSRNGGPDPGVGQKWIAYRARVSQTTVSNVENIEHTFDSPKRRVSREELIKVLACGLEVQQPILDAMLWLYDGQPLTEGEIRTSVRGCQPSAVPERYTSAQLRAVVLAAINEVVSDLFDTEGNRQATVRLFSNDVAGRIGSHKVFLSLEERPGQRLIVRAQQSAFAPPKEVLTSRSYDWLFGSSHTRTEFENLWMARQHAIISSLQRYGERAIHSRLAIERYLDEGSHHFLSIQQRRKVIENWIDNFLGNELYGVGLTERTPGLQTSCKGIAAASIEADPEWRTAESYVNWGFQAVIFSDSASVLKFLLDFEQQWDAIPKEWRCKDRVIAWLRSRLGNDSAD